eukprot:NODE_636_length_1991_cov_12.186695_g589_i0.p1 GENE.NODE_636_length_1991_cov_12.186695_g589_i0~~NODE_636_length_1991_cov_12.186695_g589_i0.p1  ORF type:complete len:631 (-),score=194.54 NODE_636_length_1991_cov_12.186695_g589_i0:97-1929(-)
MAVDPSSYSTTQHARVTDYNLVLNADFAAHKLSGSVTLSVELLTETRVLVLDTKLLTITSVTTLAGTPVVYHQGAESDVFGAPLEITLPATQAVGGIIPLQIRYSTSPDSSAIQWLPPTQTAGKIHPYLFTQCQAIHARALLPCQDTPSNKCPYQASITVPAPLVALMSAASTHHSTSGQTITYHFKQTVPMSSYLIALAVGALERRELGPRSAVWSEKEMVEQGAYEFADTEKFLDAAIAIAGPYVWGRYDILLLPPSFPYGGMENPCLTFVTPTLLAGDRSLTNVIAHEIAHSWMGNLVSPLTWEHFWMNEGFTVFLERKIIGAVYGTQQQHLHGVIGRTALENSLQSFGPTHPYTVLNVQLPGVDPDDAFSSIPYEKGFAFLFYLEGLVGGAEVMNAFLRAHCEKYQYTSVTSQEWKEFFLTHFAHLGAALEAIDWQAWLHQPGPPPVEPVFDMTLVNAAHNRAAEVVAGRPCGDMDDWSSNQKVVFLERLLELQKEKCQTAEGMAAFALLLTNLDATHHFSATRNAELKFCWCLLCIRCEMEAILPVVVDFLSTQGRMKFIRPTFRALHASQMGKTLAVKVFREKQTTYHSIAAKMCAKDLGVELE